MAVESNVPQRAVAALTPEEEKIVESLRRGDEEAFVRLVEMYHASMRRVARLYASDSRIADEVVQQAWLGVLNGLNRFEGRSSLKTWIFSILVNCAKTAAVREQRAVPFSSLTAELESDEPAVDPDRFLPAGEQWAGGWKSFPANWDLMPEDRLLTHETMEIVGRAIASLPPVQRNVISLRDIEGWESEEVCNVLGLSETNQRVLLHRARSRVRRALEAYLAGE